MIEPVPYSGLQVDFWMELRNVVVFAVATAAVLSMLWRLR